MSSSKRLSFGDPPLPANSPTSSIKQIAQKPHKHQVSGAGRLHTRTPSYGRKLAKTGKPDSVQNLPDHGSRHQRSKSNTSIPSTSPKSPGTKRDTSHAALVKNSSHVNLRKNKSTNTLSRNLSRTHLQRKAGMAPPGPKLRKESSVKPKGFELGDRSSDEDEVEEDEWEDLAIQSPRLTRSNSAKSTQVAPAPAAEKLTVDSRSQPHQQDRSPSPPALLLRYNRSAPTFNARASGSSPTWSPDPPINLSERHDNPRSSRAPPAISSISAQASRKAVRRDQSSSAHIENNSAPSSEEMTLLGTPNSNKAAANSSAADAGVSHFLPTKPTSIPNQQRRGSLGSDHGSPSSFLPNYHPQKPSSPGNSRRSGGALSAASAPKSRKSQPRSAAQQPSSRTQQRLELQRRELLRASAPTTPATPLLSDGHRGSFAVSLHSRSSSHGQSRGSDSSRTGAAPLVIKQDYEAAERQLSVIRRFRNPVAEAIARLKDPSLLSQETGSESGSKKATNRRSWVVKSDADLKAHGGSTSSIQENEPNPKQSSNPSRPSSRSQSNRVAQPSSEGSGKVRFRRQGSHDDIGLSRSQGSYDGADDDHGGGGIPEDRSAAGTGLSADAQMMQRIWESREVYDTVEDEH